MAYSYEGGSGRSGEYPSYEVAPEYFHEVKSPLDFKKADSCKYGSIEAYVATMDDVSQTQYDILVCEPSELKSDTAIVATTAWWTHLDLEHNLKMVRGAMRLGHYVLMVGPPKGLAQKDMSLSKAAYDMHRILDIQLPNTDARPDAVFVVGDSRAAMVGMGMGVDTYSRKRSVPYADLKAACVARPFSLTEWPRVIAQLGVEALSFGEFALEYGRRGQIANYIKSLLPSDPTHIHNSLRILPSLVSGQAGKLFDLSSPDMHLRLDQYKKDYWAQISEWERKFSERDNGLLVIKDGTHCSGLARSASRRGTLARLGRIQEIRGFDGSFETINFNKDVLPVDYVDASKQLGKVIDEAA